ncbi:hypothetical protein HMSSN139_18140 [Paenibacillus sp. HMSSN-139]|nr:hypothetical protein HMSSN139_18140 [Paenibacillus sp. HMSSN-139]
MKDKVMHMAVNVAGTNTLMFADSFEPVSYHRSTSISLVYDDLGKRRLSRG